MVSGAGMTWEALPLTGGVVRTRARSHLQPGELYSSSNIRLRPGDLQQVHHDRVRTTYGTATSGRTIIGVFFLSFEDATDQILMVEVSSTKTYLMMAPVGNSGSFTELTNGSSVSTKAWVVHRGDQYFVGTDADRWLVTSPTDFEIMGLNPALNIHNLINISETGSGSDAASGDYYLYAFCEYDPVNDVQSEPGYTFNSGVSGITVGKKLLLDWTAVTKTNARATKYRIYRQLFTQGLAYFADLIAGTRLFHGGFVAEVDITDLTYTDTISSRVDPDIRYPILYSFDNNVSLAFNLFERPRAFDLGVLYNDSVVVSSPGTSNQIMRFSPPGQPEYQPDHYFMYFATERSDEIVGLRVVNDRLLVLLTGSIHRVNYMPIEGSVRADAGRVQEVVTGHEGCVGRQAHTTVETSQGELLVYLAQGGLRWTAGQGVADACPDWTPGSAGLSASALSTAVLVNDPANYRLRLYSGTAVWDFYYHESQLKDNRLKCMGPSTCPSGVIGRAVGPHSNTDKVWIATNDTIYVEAEGTPADATFSTGYQYGRNHFQHLHAKGCGLTHGGNSPVITVQATSKIEGQNEDTTGLATIPNTDVEGTSHKVFDGETVGERLHEDVTVSGSSWAIGPLWLDITVTEGRHGR